MTYALPSRTTCRTPSIDDAHLGHLMVRPLVDWVVFVVLGNSCAVQNGTSRVAGSIGDTTVAAKCIFVCTNGGTSRTTLVSPGG